jgi:hypothetical protein
MRRVMLMTPCCPYVVDIVILHRSMMRACHYRATLSNIADHRQIHVSVAYVTMVQNVGYRMSGSSNPNQENENENVHRAKPGTASPQKIHKN